MKHSLALLCGLVMALVMVVAQVWCSLTKAPADLTTMAKRMGGIFPGQYAWEVIDGRSAEQIGAHG